VHRAGHGHRSRGLGRRDADVAAELDHLLVGRQAIGGEGRPLDAGDAGDLERSLRDAEITGSEREAALAEVEVPAAEGERGAAAGQIAPREQGVAGVVSVKAPARVFSPVTVKTCSASPSKKVWVGV
jgi:hypothetical protein